MRMSEAISGVALESVAGPDVPVARVVHDSRLAGPETVFVAMRGETSDGNEFIADAIARGANAIVTDRPEIFRSLAVTNSDLSLALCGHGRMALAGIAANLLRHPERELKITGVTGTNGKTTTTFLLEAMLRAANRKTLLLGTIENHLCGAALTAQHTTPEPDSLFGLLRDAVDAGATEAVMEVSSHALAQRRVWGIDYDVAVFTNLTRDHLDFHGDMETYWAAKRQLFLAGGTGAGSPRVAVVNIDDSAGRALADEIDPAQTRVIRYGYAAGDFHAADVRLTAAGSRFTLCSPGADIQIESALAGRVNVWNIVAAAAAAHARGLPLTQIADGVAWLRSVPGRFQQVECGQPFAVVVDYAHTDDALRNLIRTARELVGNSHRVITVFGCGGDRDRSKRPLMARAAAEGSDFIVLTSDNPRSEDPAAILRDIEAGFPAETRYTVVENRADAIAQAIGYARPGDIVLLAGKGHEKTQTTRTGAHPFDDVAVAQSALARLAICN